jgi:hypothetical protein
VAKGQVLADGPCTELKVDAPAFVHLADDRFLDVEKI